MLGTAADCDVTVCCVVPGPQPRQWKKRKNVALVVIVFMNLPKLHPKKDSSLPTQKRGSVEQKGGPPVTGLNVTGKNGLLQLPNRGLRIPLQWELGRILQATNAVRLVR